MFPLDLKTQKDLREIAYKMPLVFVNTHEKHIMTKEELEEMGYVGADKMDDGRYLYSAPVQIALNHYRALKKAWKKNGFAGCKKYIDIINKLPNREN